MVITLLLVALSCLYPVNGYFQMIEEAALNIDYTQGSSSGIILSPNASDGFHNKKGETKVVLRSLPNAFWLNLVYLPGTPTPGVCDDLPFLLYNNRSSTPIATKLGCDIAHFNSAVPKERIWRTVDVMITGSQQITMAVNRSDSLYMSFKLYYNIENIYILPKEGDSLPTTTSSGFIVSHEDFNFGASSSSYPRPTSNILIMNIPPTSTNLHVKYIRFNIGIFTVEICRNKQKFDNSVDQFSIYNGNEELYGCGGGKDNPNENTFNIISDKDTLKFNFTAQSSDISNGHNYIGFIMSYTVISCPDIPNMALISRYGNPHDFNFNVTCTDGTRIYCHCLNGTWENSKPICRSTTSSTLPSMPSASGKPTFVTAVGSTSSGSTDKAGQTSDETTTDNMLYIIAGSAGGGGLLLIIIITLLAVLLQRNRKDGVTKPKGSEQQSQSDTPGTEQGTFINMSSLAIGEDNYASVGIQEEKSKPNIAIVPPNNSAGMYDSPRLNPKRVTVTNQQEDEVMYSNRETINSHAQENDITNIYSDIRSETKKKRPSQSAAAGVSSVLMEDNELYGTGEL